MKKTTFILCMLVSCYAFAETNINLDLKSRYIWRGLDYGNSPSIQPSIEYSNGNFAIGTWAAYSTNSNHGGANFSEVDLYLSYGFDFGLSLGITDYMYPFAQEYKPFEFEEEKSGHAFELNASQAIGDLSISGNILLNTAEQNHNGAESGDMYFELAYAVDNISLFVGGGNGWHTVASDSDFQVTNIGLEVTKDITITDSFGFGLNEAFIVNPNTELIHFVAGISF